MKNSGKSTSKKVATKASEALQNEDTGHNTKSSAGSALSQRNAPQKKTSEDAAESASKVLQDGRTADDSKSVAGSALSQKESGTKKSNKK